MDTAYKVRNTLIKRESGAEFMGGGCRAAFLVFGAILLIGAGEPPKQSAQAQKAQRAEAASQRSEPALTPPTEPAEMVQASKETDPCGPQHYRSNEDLCAQWKAADAAFEAAQWAWWQILISAAGVVGLAITLWFNFRILHLSEKSAAETVDALEIARFNANAANEANKISQKAAGDARRNAEASNKHARASERRQARAYIGVKEVAFSGYSERGEPIVVLTIKNFGQTPASNVQYVAMIAIALETVMAPLDWSLSPKLILAPSQQWNLPVVLTSENNGDGEQPLILRCEIKFTDVFGAVWVLHQRFLFQRNQRWQSDHAGNYEELVRAALIK